MGLKDQIRPKLTSSLADVRRYVHYHLRTSRGVVCPACDRYGKVHVRALNATMVRGLMWLTARSGPRRDWVEVADGAPRWIVRSNQLPTNRFWGLVEPKPNEDVRKSDSGVYRPTRRGVAFVNGRLSVPMRAFLYNDDVEGYSVERVTVREALGVQFDYDKMMKTGVFE